MNHRIGRMIFGFGVGLLVAILSYRWIMDTAPRAERQLQETVVIAARELITSTVGAGALEIVDPLAPDRVIGKSYVYPIEGGWEVSGFYRRDEVDLWHPYLLTLDDSMALTHAKVSDKALLPKMSEDPRLEVLP
jgi:hypothetical protein